MAGRFYDGSVEHLDPRTRELIARRRRLLGPGYKLFYAHPLELVRGDGVYVYDRDGIRYLDAYNNVPVVGHCHPRVVAAIERQARTLNTNTRYLDERLLDYAERLLATHAEGLDRVMFTCSGSEAVDLALRIARHHTGARGVIVTENAYHGTTTIAAEASPDLGPAAAGSPTVWTVPAPRDGDGDEFARQVRAAAAALVHGGHGVAALILDTALVSDGVIVDPPGLLGPAAAAVREAGGCFIADEVQAGFGRSGTMWCYERHRVAADLVTMGKPMGNGMPIAGVAGRGPLIDAFGTDIRYFNTFGASSVPLAAAAQVLSVLEEEQLCANARRSGERIRAGMRAIGSPLLRGVRGAGLFVAADVIDGDTGEASGSAAAAVVNAMRERGVLIGSVGPRGSVLKIRPPLTISAEQCDQLVECLRAALSLSAAAR